MSELRKDFESNSSGFTNLFQLLRNNDFKASYEDSFAVKYFDSLTFSLSPNCQLLVNSQPLYIHKNFRLFSINNTIDTFFGFYNVHNPTNTNISFIKIAKYFNKNMSITENENSGLAIMSKSIQEFPGNTIVLFDDFGLSEFAISAVAKKVQNLGKSILFIDNSSYKNYFQDDASYFIESVIYYESVSNGKYYYSANNDNQNIEKIYFVGIIPNKNKNEEINHYLFTVTTFLKIKSFLPNFDLELILLNPDQNLISEVEFLNMYHTKGWKMASEVIIFRDLTEISKGGLNIDGSDFEAIKSAIYKEPPLKVKYNELENINELILKNTSSPEFIILGGENSRMISGGYTEMFIEKFAKYLANIIKTQYP